MIFAPADVTELLAPPMDYSDAMAEFEGEMLLAGLGWRSVVVGHWLAWLERPNRHWLQLEDMELLMERVAIALVDGGIDCG